MFILLISLFLNVEAAPIADTSDNTQPSGRTLLGIIWSCLSTIIICAWTSVHPNVPPPNRWMARWNRLRLMFWMIITPELVLAWAVRQFFAAREIRDAFNERYPEYPTWRKWTLKHGHLLQMGGFILVDPDRKYDDPAAQKGTVLTIDYFRENPTIVMPDLSPADIEDRSKGDALSKIIAILQTTWFIVQCIARGEQRLALTELELVTLALASLNAITFAIWWHKPLGVQEPVKVYWKTSETEESLKDKHPRRRKDFEMSFSDVITKGGKLAKDFTAVILEFIQDPCEEGPLTFIGGVVFLMPLGLIYIATFPLFVLFPLGTLSLLKVVKTDPVPLDTSRSRGLLASRITAALQRFRHWLTSTVTTFVEKRLTTIFAGRNIDFEEFVFTFILGWYFILPFLFVFLSVFVISLIPVFPLLFLVSFIFTAVFGIVTTISVPPGASHVPSFYAPTSQSDRWSRMVVFALFGVIFGGLHCIGWDFKFPTHPEQVVWRATSLGITVIPLIVSPIDFILGSRNIKAYGRLERYSLLTLDFIMTILLFTYVPARLSLIAQALALLRSQPSNALVAVNWTKYVPHLFSSA